MTISNTVKDLSRAVARVDNNASADPGDTPPGETLSFGEMLTSVAEGIAYQFERAGISHQKIADDARIFSNKREKNAFICVLQAKGYVER